MTRVDQTQSQSPETVASSRRRLLTSLLAGGTAIAVATKFAGPVSAAGPDVPKTDPADVSILNAAMDRESQMTATYDAAIEAVSDADDKAALRIIRDHHHAYVDALRGYLATEAGTPSNRALITASGSFSAIAATLAGLEDETVAIHTNNLNNLIGMNAATLTASIITMEARHGAALALVSGSSPQAAARV